MRGIQIQMDLQVWDRLLATKNRGSPASVAPPLPMALFQP